MGKTRYSVADFEPHIPGSGGIVSTIAQRVGCDWATARKFIKESPTLKRLFDDENEGGGDLAESVVLNNMRAAARRQRASGYIEIVDSSDAKWYLSKKFKDRGYDDRSRHEITGPDDGPIVFRVLFGDDGGDDAND